MDITGGWGDWWGGGDVLILISRLKEKNLGANYYPIASGWISKMMYKNGNYTTLYP